MMPNYRDGWTIGKTDYMICAPKGAKISVEDINGLMPIEELLAWMPLPEPYEERREEE